jgi:hypothetical protein
MTVFVLLVVVSLFTAWLLLARPRRAGRSSGLASGRLAAVVAAVGVLALPSAVVAQEDGSGEIDGVAGEWGIGVVVPDPVGITGKYFFMDRQAVEVAFGFDGADNDEIVLRGSYLYHFTDLWNIQRGDLPLYFGGGLRLLWDDDEDDVGIGIRAPVGVAWWMDRYPFEVFGEIAPLLEIEPDDDFKLTVAGGIRWYP